MANKAYGFIGLTGGGVGKLDAIDGSILADGDLAFGADASQGYFYQLVAASGAAESSPDVISPDANAGTKRWLRRHDEQKAYRASSPTNGNMAEVDADGDVVDSGLASSIFDTLGILTGDGRKVPVVNVAETGYEMVPIPNKNVLINGDFKVAQFGDGPFTSATTPANSDDTYLFDQWILLSDGNDIVDVSRGSERPTTLFSSGLALDVETQNKKFGVFQPIEYTNAEYFIGSTVTFSFYAKAGASLDNVKAAIIAWDGAADTITSDVVAAWGADGVTPTLAANWTFENVPANLSVTTAWARYSITATIDTASTTNIGVFIWNDSLTTTVGEFLYITGCQLELGSIATNYEYRSITEEIVLCQRYFEKSYNLTVAPGTVTDVGQYQNYQILSVGSFSEGSIIIRYETRKRITPTVSIYSPTTGTVAKIRDGAGADIVANQIGSGETGLTTYGTLAAPNSSSNIFCHFVADARL